MWIFFFLVDEKPLESCKPKGESGSDGRIKETKEQAVVGIMAKGKGGSSEKC